MSLRLLASLVVLAALAGAPCPARAEGAGTTEFRMAWPAGRLDHGVNDGLRWHRIRTRGNGEANVAVTARPLRPALDLRHRFVTLWLRVDGVRELSGFELRLGSGNLESHYALHLPLFTDPLANRLRDGTWIAMSFAFADARVVGRPDRAAIDRVGLYVADRGKAPVTLWWASVGLVDAPRSGVVSFTFDDGYDEHRDAAEWMAEYGYRGTAYVIPGSVGTPEYMNLTELRALRDEFGWEVSAHHETPFTDFGPERLEATILGVKRFLRGHGFDDGAEHLAYPLGKQATAGVRGLARKHFRTARMAVGGVETLPPADPHLLRAFNVVADTTPEEIGAAARRARDNREWLILMFHFLVPQASLPTEYAIDDFRRALREVAATRVPVRPLGEVWAGFDAGPDAPGPRAADHGRPLWAATASGPQPPGRPAP